LDTELLDLQTEYLNDLPDKLDLIYEFLITIEREKNIDEPLNDLKGIIHSIKGSSGSYEINFISELCHLFEDCLELLDQGSDKKEVLINCFHYYELLKEFLDFYIPGEESDLTSFYDKLSVLSAGKKEKKQISRDTTPNRFMAILICTEDQFFKDAIFLSLARQNINFSVSNKTDSLKKESPFDFIFLISPKSGDFKNITTAKKKGHLPVKAQVVSLVLGNKTQDLPVGSPYVLITHHLVKDIKAQYLNLLKEYIKIDTKKESLPEKILFVDDDESIHPLVKVAFKAHKEIEMVYCHSAKEAQDALKNFTPDFIILDSMMPDISGKEFKKILSKDKKLKEIPVVFLTGLDSNKEIKALKELGAVDVILKPFKIKELAGQVFKVWSNNLKSP